MSTSPVERPSGRDEIRAAVLEAAARRFAAQGPDASLRDIAEDAGVNLGLIHRHVGNKDDLQRAVLAREIEGGAGTIAHASDAASALRRIFEGAARDGRYIRIVAWMLLHEPQALRHQDSYPGMAALRALAADERHRDDVDDDVDADLDARLMAAMAAIYGWTVFGPQLRAAFGTRAEDRPELEQRISDIVADIIRST